VPPLRPRTLRHRAPRALPGLQSSQGLLRAAQRKLLAGANQSRWHSDFFHVPSTLQKIFKPSAIDWHPLREHQSKQMAFRFRSYSKLRGATKTVALCACAQRGRDLMGAVLRLCCFRCKGHSCFVNHVAPRTIVAVSGREVLQNLEAITFVIRLPNESAVSRR
jgi:hypothetical protein